MGHYDSLVDDLAGLFGAKSVEVGEDAVVIDDASYPLVDDIIVTLPPAQWPSHVRARVGLSEGQPCPVSDGIATKIQASFGREWTEFADLLPEHRREFERYFDLIDLSRLSNSRVCDLGCGMGRWSWFLAAYCRQLVLVDFSDAIFAARRNLVHLDNAIFVLGDVAQLPFADDSSDLIVSLGVLHHLPSNALDSARTLARLAPRALFYLYYALDNRPMHFRVLFRFVDRVRRVLARIESSTARSAITWSIAIGAYLPLVGLGRAAEPFGCKSLVPLAETYSGMGLARIRQDVYDRFFTAIEQRFSREDILTLRDTYAQIRVAPGLPYWHFVCERNESEST